MSEYQYLEFQAVDRPLTGGEQEMLRALSTRARITATSFTNHYEWGDFKGDPKRLIERDRLGAFLDEVDWVSVWDSGEHTIIDICRDEEEPDYEEWDDGTGWLAALAPLRVDIFAGDLRLFYLLWLSAVAEDLLDDDAPEPLPGLGPLTGPLEAAVEFFDIDPDLVDAAAASPFEQELDGDGLRAFVAGLGDDERTRLLVRVMEGESHVGSELRRRARARGAGDGRSHRTVGELWAMASQMREAREKAEAERRREEERRRAEEAEKARRARLDAVRRRGKSVWSEVESEIERRNASGYDRAASLLAHLKQVAADEGTEADFSHRLSDIRQRHSRKGQLLIRLQDL